MVKMAIKDTMLPCREPSNRSLGTLRYMSRLAKIRPMLCRAGFEMKFSFSFSFSMNLEKSNLDLVPIKAIILSTTAFILKG